MEFNPDTEFIHSSESLSSVPELSSCGAASDSGFLQRGRRTRVAMLAGRDVAAA